MKKIKLCLLLVLSMVIFSGCVGISGYLKIAPTSMSVATFYNNNYVQGLSVFQNVTSDSTVIYTESDRLAYKNYTKPIYELLPEERSLMSVVDFLYDINNSTNSSVQKVKLKVFEYRAVLKAELALSPETSIYADNYYNMKAVILLERADKTTSLELNTYLFYMYASSSYEIADLKNNTQNANYMFTFVQTGYNVQTKTFSLKYNTNCTAAASFSPEKGCLAYTMDTYYGQSNTQVSLEKSIYHYSNGTRGIRVLVQNGIGGQSAVAIYEQMTTDFYRRLKVGDVKDKANMLSLETMPEDDLAVSNSSDKSGYGFVYDSRRDDVVARIICENYNLN